MSGAAPTPAIAAMNDAMPMSPFALESSFSEKVSGRIAWNAGLKNDVWAVMRNITPSRDPIPHCAQLPRQNMPRIITSSSQNFVRIST